MHWQYAPYVHLLLIAALISVTLALYASRRRRVHGAAALVVLMLAVAEYSLGYALELSSADLPSKVLWAKVEYLGIVTLPVAWLAFTLQYTNRDAWLATRNLILLSILPIITLLLVWTNEAHELIWRYIGLDASGPFITLDVVYGTWFWVHSTFSYTLLLAGTIQLVLMVLRSAHLYRWQASMLLLGVLAPWVGNVLYVFDLGPISNLDLTPFGFTLLGIALAWGLFRFRLLDIVPVARRIVVDGMSDGVIVLDGQNRVVDLNPAAQNIIGHTATEAIGRPIVELLASQSDLVQRYMDRIGDVQEEIAVGEGEGRRYFDLRISALHDQHGRVSGRVIVLRDITQRQSTEQALRKAEAETRRRLEEQIALREAGNVISSTLDLNAVLGHIAEEMGRAVDATSSYIFGYDPESGKSDMLAEYSSPQARPEEQISHVGDSFDFSQSPPGIIEFLEADQPTVHHQDDAGLPEPVRSRLKQLGAQTLLTIPLQIRGQTIAYAQLLESRRQREFTSEEIALCQGMAQQAAIAIRNAQLHDEIREQAADLSTLYTITRMVSRSLVLEDALAQALSSALLSLGFEAGLICLADPIDSRLRLAAEHGLPPSFSRRLRHSGLEGTLCAYVHERQESLVLNDLKREAPVACNDLIALGFQTYAGIPLHHRGQSLGSISLLTRQPQTALMDKLALLSAIGDQVATAVANAQYVQTIANERSRLGALIQSSRDGIILIGMDRRALVTNARALELLRLPGRAEEWADRPLEDALTALQQHAPAIVQAISAEMQRIERGDEPTGEGEYEVPPYTIHWLNLPVTANGNPLGRLLVLRDVTEERLLERMREDLTHMMVHDLRNPVTSIFGWLTLLQQSSGDFSDAQNHMVEAAFVSVEKLSELINNILSVSQLESGQVPVVRRPVLLADLIDEAFQAQRPLATKKGLHLGRDVTPGLPAVYADTRLIGRVLQNLIDNAIKFTPAGGSVTVTVGPTHATGAGQVGEQEVDVGYLRISVSDSGPGIPPELQKQLFQKFATGRQEASGSGLGLAFCKLAVEAHGGSIWAESKPEQGATFCFTLPMTQEGEAKPPWVS